MEVIEFTSIFRTIGAIMSSYTQEQYKQDKIAVDAAIQDLSALTIGQKVGRTAIYQGEYARIAQYFEPVHEQVRDTARMFMHISTADRISGFDCLTYQARLEQIVKKIKSMRVFRRRLKIRCLFPKLHEKGCVCADWKRLMEASNESQESGPEKPSRAEESALERVV